MYFKFITTLNIITTAPIITHSFSIQSRAAYIYIILNFECALKNVILGQVGDGFFLGKFAYLMLSIKVRFGSVKVLTSIPIQQIPDITQL